MKENEKLQALTDNNEKETKSKGSYLTGKEIRKIAKANKKVMKRLEAYKYRKAPESEFTTSLKDTKNILEIDQLCTYFFTDQGVVKAVNGVSFDIPKNATVGVVGESGCGKSTLLALASGMKLAQHGSVTWNTVEINQLSLDTIRSQVGYMGQDIYVFSGTVYDNIAMGDSTITMEQVQQACAAIGFDKIVETFAQGYNTLLGENGRGLSGGQKRMLGMARILVRDRKFVVCDEPLAGLDVQSEQMVYQALNRLLEGRTALLVSHREEIIHLADRVYFMEQGKLR